MTLRYTNRASSISTASIGSGEYSYTWEHPNPWIKIYSIFEKILGDKADEFISLMEQNAQSLEDFMDFAYIKGNGGQIEGNLSIEGDLTVDGFPIVPVPTGTIAMFAGDTAPPGWVVCDGTAYDASDPIYASLSGICNNAYDTSAGQPPPTTGYFRVPILVGRVPLGYWSGTYELGDYAEITTSAGDNEPGYLVVNYIIKL
jgi:hypothetical protein